MSAEVVQKSDIPIAYKALCIAPGLSGTDRQVAAAIIDHFNYQSGQCDPGGDRLATMLGINRVSVIRATDRLHAAGLIEKISHGGHGHRSTYRPNWERLRSIVDDWQARMKSGSEPESTPPTTVPKVAELQLSESQSCNIESYSSATQTNITNQTNKPKGTVLARGTSAHETVFSPQEPKRQSEPTGQNGLWNGKAWTGQRQQSKVAPSPTHQQAARAAAERRVNQDLMALGLEPYADAIERMSSDDQDAATAAEVRRRGGGIALLFERLGILGQQSREGVTDAIH